MPKIQNIDMNAFQEKMYKHLQKQFGTGESVFLSDSKNLFYSGIRGKIFELQEKHGFDFHRFVTQPHVASSQAACINLFLPIMESECAVDVLKTVKTDIASIDKSHISDGFTFEYWRDNPRPNDGSKGLLNDHSKTAGTDSDFALSYIDNENRHCLWLVEHKLTETEFTQCNAVHNGKHKELLAKCSNYTAQHLMNNDEDCYYCHARHFNYWQLTKKHIEAFPNLDIFENGCPFMDGMCQLWRNTLLVKAAQEEYQYDKVFFSVVKPHDNIALNNSLKQFKAIVDPVLFSVFHPTTIVDAAISCSDSALRDWGKWYTDTYLNYDLL